MDPWPNFTYYPYCMVKEPYRCGPHSLDLCDGCSTIRALIFERDRYKAALKKMFIEGAGNSCKCGACYVCIAQDALAQYPNKVQP